MDPITATGPAEILYSGAPGDDGAPIKLTATLRTDDDPASLEFRLGREDADNFLRALIAVASGSVTVRPGMELDGDTIWFAEAVELDDADLATNTVVEICWTPGASQTSVETSQARAPTQADDEGGGWTDPTNIFADDGLEATTTPTTDTDTDALLTWGYQFSLQPGSTPLGIVIGAGVEYPAVDGEIVDQSVTYSTASEGPSDQMASGTQVPDDGSNGSQSWGSDSDLQGLTPTWLEINDETDFVTRNVWHANGSVGSSTLNVDWFVVEVYYATPDRLVGTLTVKIGDQCVTFNNIPWFGDETDVSIGFLVGDWELSNFVLSYAESATRPSCPDCECDEPVSPPGECDYCATGLPPAGTYTADFGAGGWTASPCDQCTNVSGIIALTQGFGFPECNWIAYDVDPTDICFFDWDNTTCGPLTQPFVDPDCSPTMGIMYRLILESDGMGGFYWQLTVDMATMGGHPARPKPAFARYTSASFADDECQDGPWTLTKDIDTAGDSCGGALPGTVTLEVA